MIKSYLIILLLSASHDGSRLTGAVTGGVLIGGRLELGLICPGSVLLLLPRDGGHEVILRV